MLENLLMRIGTDGEKANSSIVADCLPRWFCVRFSGDRGFQERGHLSTAVNSI